MWLIYPIMAIVSVIEIYILGPPHDKINNLIHPKILYTMIVPRTNIHNNNNILYRYIINKYAYCIRRRCGAIIFIV